jgi:hypothetical protein
LNRMLRKKKVKKRKKNQKRKKEKEKEKRGAVYFLCPHGNWRAPTLTYTHSYTLPTYKLQYRKRHSFTRLKPLFSFLSLSWPIGNEIGN